MNKLLLLTAIFFTIIMENYAEDLIPRRIVFKSDPEVPSMLTDIFFSSIAEYQPIIAVDEKASSHNTIELGISGDEIHFTLNENSEVLDILSYPRSTMNSYESLYASCQKTAQIWSESLVMVSPQVNEELVYERTLLAEEVALELRLASDYQMTFWLPAAIILDLMGEESGSSAGSLEFFWPVGIEFYWFVKDNVGFSASFSYEYDPADVQIFNRFIPGIGFNFRTLGRFSAEFGIKLNFVIVNISDSSGSQWEAFPTIELTPMISWNFNDFWSIKSIIFGYDMDLLAMFGADKIDWRNQITLLHLGLAYRW
ncbi:MAG: hypothetical protein DRP60_06440 [Spirochaetes bacterium]|nr:MAG: hypothetical protein DRP60_06440 [Spirochaetota bacterium]